MSKEKQESQCCDWAEGTGTDFLGCAVEGIVLAELAGGPRVRVSPGRATRKHVSTKRLFEQASSTPLSENAEKKAEEAHSPALNKGRLCQSFPALSSFLAR